MQPDPTAATYSLHPLVPLARWLRATRGDAAFAEICLAAAVEPAWFDDAAHRVGAERVEALLAAARARLAGDDELMDAMVSTAARRLPAWVLTPSMAYAHAARQRPPGGRLTRVAHGPSFVRLRYTSASRESRLMCLMRQAHLLSMPRAWDIRAAAVREERCLARGDEACEYVVRWCARPRWIASALGAAAGLAALAALVGGNLAEVPLVGWVLPAAGALLAHLVEIRRVERMNQHSRDELAQAFGWAVRRVRAAREEPAVVASVPAPPPTDVAPEPTAIFRAEGQFWRIGWQDSTILLRHTRGLALLAGLLRNPGTEIHARALDALTPSETKRGPSPPPAVAATDRVAADLGDAGEVFDAQAKAAYRRRLVELREELADAEGCNDPGRAAVARAEIDALAEQLRSATGLGGRGRRAHSDVDRVRVALTRRIRAAITLIAKHHPALGEHLEKSVRTGYFFAYEPAGEPVAWTT